MGDFARGQQDKGVRSKYPVPCSRSAPLTVENSCWSFLPDVFFPLWKPPQAWGGAEGTEWPWVSLWVFSGGGGRIGRMALLYSLV